jgi:hypothetical protein
MFRYRQSSLIAGGTSPGIDTPFCMQAGAKLVAVLTPFQWSTCRGARQRRSPTGGAANGTPLNTVTFPTRIPWTEPDSVSTTGFSAANVRPGCADTSVARPTTSSIHLLAEPSRENGLVGPCIRIESFPFMVSNLDVNEYNGVRCTGTLRMAHSAPCRSRATPRFCMRNRTQNTSTGMKVSVFTIETRISGGRVRGVQVPLGKKKARRAGLRAHLSAATIVRQRPPATASSWAQSRHRCRERRRLLQPDRPV